MANFKPEEFVWAKMKTYPPWPGKIMIGVDKDPPSKKKEYQYVYFFGYDNHNWIPVKNICTYVDNVEECGTPSAKRNQYFTAALNYIHEQYWCLVELKREDPMISGCYLDSDDEKEFQEEDRKAGRNVEQRKRERKRQRTIRENVGNSSWPLDNPNQNTDNYDAPDFSCHVPFSNDSSSLPTLVENPDGSITIIDESPDGESLSMLPNIFGAPPKSASNSPSHSKSNKTKVKPPCKYKNRLGFIGLGKINQMIFKEYLEKKNYDVNIWSKVSYKYEKFLIAGANRTNTPQEAITSSYITFCTMPDYDVSVHFSFVKAGIYDGFANSGKSRKIYVSLTSADQEPNHELRKAIIKLGGIYFEIKYSFANEDTQSVTLSCSGDFDIYVELKEYLKHVTENIAYVESGIPRKPKKRRK